MSPATRFGRLDRLLLRGVFGVAFSALILAAAGSQALRPLAAAGVNAEREPTSGQRDEGDVSNSEPASTALCARADAPLITLNRNS